MTPDDAAYDRLLARDPLLRVIAAMHGRPDLDDAAAVAALPSAQGVGLWTARMFLSHQHRRSDVLPSGDLGIRRAVRALLAQSVTPTSEDVTAYRRRWSPWRTFAAALLWAPFRPAVPAG